MAKVAFTKLNKIKTSGPISCKIGEEEIQIQSYLPIEEKLELIQRIIEQAGNNEEGFYNIVKLKVFYTIEMIKTYTNISFTEKQLENSAKLYDLIVLNHIWDSVESNIPKSESTYIWDNLLAIAREVTNYNHSFLGVLKALKVDYNDLDFDAIQIENKLANSENLDFLKEILNKLG